MTETKSVLMQHVYIGLNGLFLPIGVKKIQNVGCNSEMRKLIKKIKKMEVDWEQWLLHENMSDKSEREIFFL